MVLTGLALQMAGGGGSCLLRSSDRCRVLYCGIRSWTHGRRTDEDDIVLEIKDKETSALRALKTPEAAGRIQAGGADVRSCFGVCLSNMSTAERSQAFCESLRGYSVKDILILIHRRGEANGTNQSWAR